MSSNKRPFELRNIKDNPDGYQIQFIVDGKSHSAFSTDLEKAKKIRDKMEKKLKVVQNGVFKRRPGKYKISYIPGTDKVMRAGICLRIQIKNNHENFGMAVNWKDHTGRRRIKSFYACTETRYSVAKMRAAYKLAVNFREAYEQAVLDDKLEQFNPDEYSLSAVNAKISNTPTMKKLRIQKKLRRR